MLTLKAPGAFFVPAAINVPVAVTAAANTYANTRTEIIAANNASTARDFFILGYRFTGQPDQTYAFRFYVGASNGTLIHEESIDAPSNGIKNGHFPLPLLVPGASRISVDGVSNSAGASTFLGLQCALRGDIVEDSAIATGVLEGQVAPATNVMTDLATVAAGRFAPGVVVRVNNQGALDQLVTVAVSPLGAAYNAGHDVVTKIVVKAGTVLPVPIPYVLQGTDVIRVSTNGNVATYSVVDGAKVLTATTSIVFTVASVTIS